MLLRVDQLGELEDGEILVAPVTSPSWTPVFHRIAGAVLDTGGIMCHAAIVAREYGLPAVVGTGTGTKTDQDGRSAARRRRRGRRDDPRTSAGVSPATGTTPLRDPLTHASNPIGLRKCVSERPSGEVGYWVVLHVGAGPTSLGAAVGAVQVTSRPRRGRSQPARRRATDEGGGSAASGPSSSAAALVVHNGLGGG